MIKSNKLFSLLILSTALSFTACSGGGDNIQQVNNVENNSSTSEATDSTPDQAIKPRAGSKVNYDNLAESFLLEDKRELLGVLQAFVEVYTPSVTCFNYWYKRGANTPTKQQKSDCQLWVQEVADLYASYGYDVPADVFKSEIYWDTLQKYADKEYNQAYKTARKNDTVRPNCSTRPQVNYQWPTLIEDAKKTSDCRRFERQ